MTLFQAIAMIKLIVALLVVFPLSAQAQYRCTVNGKSVYSDIPCGQGAKDVSSPADRVTHEQTMQRRYIVRQERRDRAEIDAREDAEMQEEVQAINSRLKTAAAERKGKCQKLRDEIRRGGRAAAVYHDVNWQQSKRLREAELEQNRSEYNRSCR